MATSKQQQLASFLLQQLKSPLKVKTFSQYLRDFNICDLRKEEDAIAVASNEGAYLLTLITYFEFGMLGKLKQIQEEIAKQNTKE